MQSSVRMVQILIIIKKINLIVDFLAQNLAMEQYLQCIGCFRVAIKHVKWHILIKTFMLHQCLVYLDQSGLVLSDRAAAIHD